MAKNRFIIALVLAGGRGMRLSELTSKTAKPAVPFGGKWRLIDFSLSNCANSGIKVAGVLTPPRPFEIVDSLLATDDAGCRPQVCCLYELAPPAYGGEVRPYKGTANAVFANISFIRQFDPEYVLVLSGDHVYKMDYGGLIRFHEDKDAALTVAAVRVPWNEAGRFGIITIGSHGAMANFVEKPSCPDSNLASMGVYVFKWSRLRYYLERDEEMALSAHDFGKDVIPAMLAQGERLFAYPFAGYWKDVGTVKSLYDAHMDLLGDKPVFDPYDGRWPFYPTCRYGGGSARVYRDRERNSLINEGCVVEGEVENSVVSADAYVCATAVVKSSVIMPGAFVGPNAYVERAVIGPGAIVGSGQAVRGGADVAMPVAVLGESTELISGNGRTAYG